MHRLQFAQQSYSPEGKLMVSAILVKRPAGTLFFWNIDANVGLRSPNNTDDVQLAQLGYSIMATSPKVPPELKSAAAAVKLGVPCTGLEDDPLVRAIRAHEKTHGGTQDGYVSVIRTNNGVYHDSGGAHAFLLTAIVNNIFDAMPGDFPRIDKHPSCPAALKASVLKVMNR
jgi:hypothetical protein